MYALKAGWTGAKINRIAQSFRGLHRYSAGVRSPAAAIVRT